MIKPHGAETLTPLYVSDDAERAELTKEAEQLPSVLLSSGAAASAVMLASGYFTPLTGYMNIAEATSVAADMKLPNGLFWPVPVMNIVPSEQLTDAVKNADRIALRDPNVEGNPPLAVMKVSAIETLSTEQKQLLIEKTFGTTDPEHPGVPAFANVGENVLSGPIEVLNYSYFREDFPDTFRTAVEIREDIAARGWNTVVAFQTRNPMHRAHEELCKIAQREVNADGVSNSYASRQVEAGGHPRCCSRFLYPCDGAALLPRKYCLYHRLRIRYALRRTTGGTTPRSFPSELWGITLHRRTGPCRRRRLLRCV